MKTILILAAACLALAACKTAEESLRETGNKPLGAAQIEKLLSGSEGSGTTSQGTQFTMKHTADGKVMVKSAKWEDTGKWSVKGKDLYCNQYTKLRKGELACRRVYDVGGEYQFVRKDGSLSSKVKLN